MAKRKAGQRRARAADAPGGKSKPEAVTIKIQVEPSPDTPIYYANFAEIAHSQHDFVLSFVRVPAKSPSAKMAQVMETGVLPLEPVAQITFPPTMARPLIEALERQIVSYERNVGPITGKGVPDAEKG